MAMVKCKEPSCGKEISSDADACPFCGKKTQKMPTCIMIPLGCFGLFFLFFFFGAMLKGCSDVMNPGNSHSPTPAIVATNTKPSAKPEVKPSTKPGVKPSAKPIVKETRPTAKPSMTPEKKFDTGEYSVGQSIDTEDRTLVINRVIFDFKTGNQFSEPKSGNIFVVINLTMTNKSNRAIPVSDAYFKIEDEDGVRRNSNSFIVGIERPLEWVDLSPNGKINGSFGFEVPKTSRVLKLHFEPSIFSSKDYIIKIVR